MTRDDLDELMLDLVYDELDEAQAAQARAAIALDPQREASLRDLLLTRQLLAAASGPDEALSHTTRADILRQARVSAAANAEARRPRPFFSRPLVATLCAVLVLALVIYGLIHLAPSPPDGARAPGAPAHDGTSVVAHGAQPDASAGPLAMHEAPASVDPAPSAGAAAQPSDPTPISEPAPLRAPGGEHASARNSDPAPAPQRLPAPRVEPPRLPPTGDPDEPASPPDALAQAPDAPRAPRPARRSSQGSSSSADGDPQPSAPQSAAADPSYLYVPPVADRGETPDGAPGDASANTAPPPLANMQGNPLPRDLAGRTDNELSAHSGSSGSPPGASSTRSSAGLTGSGATSSTGVARSQGADAAPATAPEALTRARLRLTSGDLDGAALDLDRAVETASDATTRDAARHLRGLTRQRQGDHLGAVEDLRAVLEDAPDHPQRRSVELALALSLIELGSAEAGAERLRALAGGDDPIAAQARQRLDALDPAAGGGGLDAGEDDRAAQRPGRARAPRSAPARADEHLEMPAELPAFD